MQPSKVYLIDRESLWIRWDDNSETEIPLKKLREFCPCATCLAERANQSSTFIPLMLSSQTEVKNIEQVGTYAIQITWKDGHNTGIYEYPFLRSLAEQSTE